MILSSFPLFIKHLVHNTINFDYENDNWIDWEHSDYNKNKFDQLKEMCSKSSYIRTARQKAGWPPLDYANDAISKTTRRSNTAIIESFSLQDDDDITGCR